jgi:hypothetical protein
MNNNANENNYPQWEILLKQLPGVLNAEITNNDEGQLTEIHVLATSDRLPKQIVRDVQSALMAEYKAKVDYRIISVAQIDFSSVNHRDPRIKLNSLNLVLGEQECQANVTLTYLDQTVSGTGCSDCSRTGRYTAIAQAAVGALNAMLPKNRQLSINELQIEALNHRSIILVELVFGQQPGSEVLVGCCNDHDDGGISVIKAVLSAINRRFYNFLIS